MAVLPWHAIQSELFHLNPAVPVALGSCDTIAIELESYRARGSTNEQTDRWAAKLFDLNLSIK